nr:hypothetical protein [Tanacetum cinerariifolium]
MDGEAMINSIKNGDQPLPTVTQVSIAGATSSEQPPLKDKSMCIKTAEDLCDALERHMLGSEYGEQDRKATVLIMIIKKEQQQALDDALVPREQRLRIGNSNYKLSTTFKPKEPTFQATITFQKHNIKFKMNKKSYSFDLETFKDMFQICPKVPDQKFMDPPFEEEILAFMCDLGYPGNIKTLSEAIPKPKYVRRFIKEKSKQALKASSGKRIKSAAKVTTRLRKKKQIAEGLETLSEVALSEVEQMKLAIKICKTQLHSSQPNGSGAHQGTSVTPGSITDLDNDGDDFIHPKFSTHDEKDKEEDSFNFRVQTPYHVGSTDDEDSDEEIQGVNVDAEKVDKEETNKEDEWDELYRDSSSVSPGFVSNMLNPSPDTGVDFIFNLNNESTSLVDVSITSIAETPLLSATTLAFTPTTVPSSSLQDLPNFCSLFGFTHKLKTLEIDFLEFKQTNQFATAVSLILGIVDSYLAKKINEAIKAAV